MFHPVSAVKSRDNQPNGKAVQHWQGFAIHLESEEDLSVKSMVDGQRLHEVGGLGKERSVEPIECDLDGVPLYPGFGQNIFQTDAAPFRIPHGAVSQLSSRHTWVEKATAIS